MKPSNQLLALQKQFEDCRLQAYRCPAGKWTIGWGNTFYTNGNSVKLGDKITQQQADDLYMAIINQTAEAVTKALKAKVSQNQFDVLVDIAYNAGLAALLNSGLWKAVNTNPNDARIADYLLQWDKADGSHNGKDDDGDGIVDEAGEKQQLKGLTRRCLARRKMWLTC